MTARVRGDSGTYRERLTYPRAALCNECECEFTATTHANTLCSDDCRVVRDTRRRPPRKYPRERPCRKCGRPFLAPTAAHALCSDICRGSTTRERSRKRAQAAVKNPKRRGMVYRLPPIPCRGCAVAFVPHWVGVVYCSEDCRATAIANRERHRREAGHTVKTRPCARCGTPAPILGGRRFCSLRCYREDCNERARVKHDPRPCAWCQQDFRPKRSDQRSCSLGCRWRSRARVYSDGAWAVIKVEQEKRRRERRKRAWQRRRAEEAANPTPTPLRALVSPLTPRRIHHRVTPTLIPPSWR